MKILGIDPGLSGALAVLGGPEPVVFDAPIVKVGTRNEYVLDAMVGLLRPFAGASTIVVIEKVHAIPGNGSIGCFSLGYGYGLWRGIVSALGLRIDLVSPERWKKAMLAGSSARDKGASLQRARELFPTLAATELTRVKDHGRAEALLIAEWARRFGGLS